MRVLLWLAVPLLLLSAAMLVASVGAPSFWISVVGVGIAIVAIDISRNRSAHR